MSKSSNLICKVIDYIYEAMKLRPQYTKDMLYTEDSDSVIFYMNGNDGTDFDWDCNGRACEFMVFFKETEMGFIKVCVNSDDTITGWLYESDYKYGDNPTELEELKLNNGDAKYIAALMYNIADRRELWDKALDQLDTGYELKQYEVDMFGDDDEEEEW